MGVHGVDAAIAQQAYQVQAVDTGEMLTIVENGSLAPPATTHRRAA